MRRTPSRHDSARAGRVWLAAALLGLLCGSLMPSVAAAAAVDDRPTDPGAAATAEPTGVPTEPADDGEDGAEPTEAPAVPEPTEPADLEPTEPAADDDSEESGGDEADEPTPADQAQSDEAETDDATGEIPTPQDGDYVGSVREHEADPGGYGASQDGALKAMRLNDFDPGNIISDEVLYTSGTMSAGEIQAFLDRRVPVCQSGYTCLKDFWQSTATKQANTYCTGTYQSGYRESAATIISKVAKACDVSEQVLLVMLQKEQGLVTHVWPSDWRYDTAMGFACPDTGPGNSANCDSTYFGFFNQMYMAAYQLQRYTKDSYFSWYPVGKTSQVLWHPNRGCGSGPVRIENNATAALYYYTPYQPNRAALAAGYGTGDGCSSYGNRNFYNYYTDWFGSTRITTKGAIDGAYRALGGSAGRLGDPVANQSCGHVGGGCYQQFEGGRIYWSPSTGAKSVWGSIFARWNELDRINGRLGYPTAQEKCGLPGGGCYQSFQRGKIYWQKGSGGAHAIWGAFQSAYSAQSNEHGRLGFPTSTPGCWIAGEGCFQTFEGGRLYWHPDHGAHPVWGSIGTAWQNIGSVSNRLGYPIASERCGLPGSGCYQKFQGGRIYWKSSTGAKPIWGATLTAWRGQGSERGALGYPTNTESWQSDGRAHQSFEGGEITYNRAEGAVIRPTR